MSESRAARLRRKRRELAEFVAELDGLAAEARRVDKLEARRAVRLARARLPATAPAIERLAEEQRAELALLDDELELELAKAAAS